MTQMMLGALQLAAQVQLFQGRFELLLPLPMESRWPPSPLLRGPLGHVAR